jgi:hypothetical protein
VLVARSLAEDPLAVLFGYGCHPVSAGYQTLYDPDYPGEAVSWVEDLTGAFAQFLLGPAGDQDPSARVAGSCATHRAPASAKRSSTRSVGPAARSPVRSPPPTPT